MALYMGNCGHNPTSRGLFYSIYNYVVLGATLYELATGLFGGWVAWNGSSLKDHTSQ